MSVTTSANAGSARSGQPIFVINLSFVGLAALGVFLWEEVLKDRLIAKRFGVVDSMSIYRSGQLSHFVVEGTLREHGIDVIVDLT